MIEANVACFDLIEDFFESFTHRWGTTHPHFLNIISIVLCEFLSDEVSVPSPCVYAFLTEPNYHPKVGDAVVLAVIMECLAKVNAKGITPRRKRNVEYELESVLEIAYRVFSVVFVLIGTAKVFFRSFL